MTRQSVPIVKPRSRKSVERRALQIRSEAYPDLGEDEPFPVGEFLEFLLPERYGVEVRPYDLPSPTEAVMVPRGLKGRGSTMIIFSSHVWEQLYQGEGRSRFTGMHEAYHAIEHAAELFTPISHSSLSGLYRQEDIPAYRNPEWQANAFAAAILMPERAVTKLVHEQGLTPRQLARVFLVSPTAAEVRLDVLGLR